VKKLVEPAVGERGFELGPGMFDGVMPERVDLSGVLPTAELKSQPRSASHGAPRGVPLSVVLKHSSSARARCLSRPPRVGVDTPKRVCGPAE
jgi:hypothetical protein